jgi:hypothetical protein
MKIQLNKKQLTSSSSSIHPYCDQGAHTHTHTHTLSLSLSIPIDFQCFIRLTLNDHIVISDIEFNFLKTITSSFQLMNTAIVNSSFPKNSFHQFHKKDNQIQSIKREPSLRHSDRLLNRALVY